MLSLIGQERSDKRSNRRETRPQRGRVSRSNPVETQQRDQSHKFRTGRHPESTL